MTAEKQRAPVDLPLMFFLAGVFLAPITAGMVALDGLAMPAGGFLAGVASGDLPVAGQAIPCLLILLAGLLSSLQRRVFQVPWAPLAAFGGGLAFLVFATVGFSQFRFASQLAAIHWATYIAAFFIGTSLIGRRRGPKLLLGTVAASCTVVALKALMEYADTRSPMFAGWSNPNALAGILLVGIFCALGLASASRERAALPTLASVAMGLALVLTQSKGGLLVLGISAVVFVVIQAIWLTGTERVGALKRTGLALGLLAVLVGALQFAPRASAGPEAAAGAPLGRVTAAGETQAQSFTFRKLLFQTSADIAQKNPAGTGIGTFYYHSAQPGRVTSTVYAHNTTLQLLAETSILGAILFVGFWILWMLRMARGAREQTAEANALRAGVLCAALAVGAHSMIESSFSYVGLGLAAFALAAAGLLLANDSVMPEQVLPPARYASAVAFGLLMLGWVVNLRIESGRASAFAAIQAGDASAARAAAEGQQGMGAGDPQTWTLAAMLSQSPEERLQNLERVRALAPTPKLLREIAMINADLGESGKAVSALNEALQWDPNNLLALRQLMELERREGRIDAALEIARRLVEVEQKTVFTVRSIAEIIPTETYQARLFLAQEAADSNQKREVLEPSIDGWIRYATITVPQIVRFVQGGMPGYAGERPDNGRERLAMGLKAIEIYKDSGGDQAKANDARAQLEAADRSLAELATP